ncbi:alpha/beta hydrolase [Marinimicrobium sp. ABcell2]|uniref:alpha/beta hydrolase n=1 Tax=Marinimicrobium sp. ABcell2 TaxID=3069751 RepID=UPI0027B39DA7|nr:alpha/beta hydrolase [Marinimicrobium sp. ABcell2]MDQ2076603.1 alpha/beta hydrolase [Marinimicrobium sp. ABcell2]
MSNPLFNDLAQRLPALRFDPKVDGEWALDVEAQAYLDYYNINLTRDYSDVCHGFGRVSAAGFSVATHYWLPKNPRGTLVVVHGYYDHVGLYDKALRFGLDQGYAVLTFDLPGHGLSTGAHASIDSFDQYADALNDVLNAAESLLPSPWHCLAQSTGGAAVLNYLWRHSNNRLERIALCAPLILPFAWRINLFVYWLLRLWVKRVRRVFVDSSHDEAFNHFVRERDGLQYRYLPVTWVTAMRHWDSQFFRFPRSDKSLLVVQGTGDTTVDWRYNLMQIRRKLPHAHTHMIKGARHHLVNETPPYRQQVFAAIAQWLDGGESIRKEKSTAP